MCADRCSTDGNKPDVSLEDAELIEAMFSLFHGSGQKGAQLPAEQTAQPASAAVRARLMSLLKRSLAAANAFPDNLQVHSHACALTLAPWRALCKFNLPRPYHACAWQYLDLHRRNSERLTRSRFAVCRPSLHVFLRPMELCGSSTLAWNLQSGHSSMRRKSPWSALQSPPCRACSCFWRTV